MCHSGLIIESALERYRERNKQTNNSRRKKRTETGETGETGLVSLRFPFPLIRNSHILSVQSLHTPWWRLWSHNLLLGRASCPLWWPLKFSWQREEASGRRWKRRLSKGSVEYCMVKITSGLFQGSLYVDTDVWGVSTLPACLSFPLWHSDLLFLWISYVWFRDPKERTQLQLETQNSSMWSEYDCSPQTVLLPRECFLISSHSGHHTWKKAALIVDRKWKTQSPAPKETPALQLLYSLL